MDSEQQTAFEILAATYVLTFYDEAQEDVVDLEERVWFGVNKQKLEQLA